MLYQLGMKAISLLVLLALTTPVFGQTKETTQLGVNSVTVMTYAPRDASEGKLPAAMLKEDWDTEREVRWDLAAVLALLAEQSHNDDDEMLGYLIQGLGFNRWVAIKNNTMAAHVVSGDGVAVVIFRGTNITEIPDWYQNLSVAFITTREGRPHSGFVDAYRMVKRDVHRFLDEAKPDKLWVTGHSLGGAMALACGIDLELKSEHKPHLVTFGQPRLADSDGAKWIDQRFQNRYVRFVRGDDIVPSVPFYVSRAFPYSHAGRLIAISENGLSTAASVLATPVLAATYCGSCGRSRMLTDVSVYQPLIEPPPLTQADYEASLRLHSVTVLNTMDGGFAAPSQQTMEVQFLPNYFTDHFMSGYRELIRR